MYMTHSVYVCIGSLYLHDIICLCLYRVPISTCHSVCLYRVHISKCSGASFSLLPYHMITNELYIQTLLYMITVILKLQIGP